MLNRYTGHIRKGTMGAVVLWLGFNLVVWSCCGRYAEVGMGLRLAGMLLWGLLPGAWLMLLAAPPVRADGSMKWQAPLSMPRLVPLMACFVALVWASGTPLGAVYSVTSDAEILIWGAGLLFVVYLVPACLVLGLLTYLLQWVVQLLFLRKRA